MTVKVVDLSHWNVVKDWRAARDSGLVAVIHKATEGTGYNDPTYAGRCEAARAAGLKWGAYHFLKPGSDASIEEQMEWFLKVVKPWDGMRLAIDYEDSGLTLTHLKRALSTLVARCPAAQVAIYAGSLLKEQLGSASDDFLATFPLWLAQYTTGKPKWPSATWEVWSLWQYSDKGSVPGIVPPTDVNNWNGTDKNLIAWMGDPGVEGTIEYHLAQDDAPTPVTRRITVRYAGNCVVRGELDNALEPDEIVVEAEGAKVWVSMV